MVHKRDQHLACESVYRALMSCLQWWIVVSGLRTVHFFHCLLPFWSKLEAKVITQNL